MYSIELKRMSSRSLTYYESTSLKHDKKGIAISIKTRQVQILIGNHAEMQQHAAIVLLLLSTDARLI